MKVVSAESLRFPPRCQSSEGEAWPKDNHVLEHGKPMDSRLIFLPHKRMRREDGRYTVRRIIGFASLAVDQGDRKIRPHTVDADGTAVRRDLIQELSKKSP